MLIGITGGTGCGKSTAIRALQELGFTCLDADAVYHELLENDAAMLAEIEAAFPGTVSDGKLQRKALGAIVFANPEKLKLLGEITHPYVRRACIARMLTANNAIDAIQLDYSGEGFRYDYTVAVLAPEETRISRLMERDGISREYAESRIHAQKSNEEFAAACDYTLMNDGTAEEFLEKCRELFRKLIDEKKNDRRMTMKENVMYEMKNGYARLAEGEREEMEAYCARYMNFMSIAKTEREAVTETIRVAQQNGFKEFKAGMQLQPGDKIYSNNRGKSIIFAVMGKKSLEEGCHITAAHADSPRLDLKPNPLYEDSELAYLRTHYYGGIKKYQWTTVPLALHGVVTLQDGTVKTICIGEEESDPIFCITDLLIHLAGDQMQKTLATGVTGENLRVLMGSEPMEGEEKEAVKKGIMTLLNEKYGFVEEDFISAELTFVPAGRSREVGLDRSLLAAYGHDDRVCVYAEFEPLLNLGTPEYTAVCVIADKEEIGSVGISGMQSDYFEYFMEDLCDTQGVKLRHCFHNSVCISADVSAGFDPLYPEVSERQNNGMMNYGIVFAKYTGARGKSGCNDAPSELFAYVRSIMNKADVVWQSSELGKVDQGGGGTVAAFMGNRNIPTIDAGVPVLSMHAPLELVTKIDAWNTCKAMRAFYLAD